MLVALPTTVQAQDYTYTTSGGAVTITGYSGPGGVVSIPGMIGTLPVTSIGSYAFYECSDLTNVTIPGSVTSIGNSAFSCCTRLTAITVAVGNTAYSSLDGVLFDQAKTTLIQCPGGKTGAYTIPSGVTSIGGHAFYDCTGLTSVTIPSGVTSIGNDAFSYCTGLTSVTIPSSVTSIGSDAFYCCSVLSGITVAVGNTSYSSLDGVLFNPDKTTLIQCPGGKTGAYTIPGSVTSIGSYAFYYCSRLTSVTIPSGVTSIGSNAFRSCAGLTDITVAVGNSAYSSLDGILYNPAKTTLIQCPGGKTGAYSIPSGVISIGDYAFRSCVGLTNVTIPSGVMNIGNYAFSYCTGLTSVTIPSSVTSIGISAFRSCTGLPSVTIPSSVTSIGSEAFYHCTLLTAITVAAGNTAYSSLDGVLFNSGKTTLIQCPGGKTGVYSIPSSVTSIGSYAFYYCTGLTSVTFPSGVTSIGSCAFYYCTGLGSASFTGNAPMMGSSVFGYAASGFTVYYTSGATDFTSPTWNGFPAVSVWGSSPVVTTTAASGIAATTAILNGTVNPTGTSTTAQFQYGLTTAYGSTASVTLAPANGTTVQTVSANISGLEGGRTYHYRLTAINSGGPSQGEDMIFVTAVQHLDSRELAPPRIVIAGGNLNFTVLPSVAGRKYQLQYSNTMAAGTWQNLGAQREGDGSNLVISIPYVRAVTRRFYRLALVGVSLNPG